MLPFSSDEHDFSRLDVDAWVLPDTVRTAIRRFLVHGRWIPDGWFANVSIRHGWVGLYNPPTYYQIIEIAAKEGVSNGPLSCQNRAAPTFNSSQS